MRIAGFSLMEVMIAAAIIAILATLLYLVLPRYLQRARDARRKDDLQRYKIALEEYFTDKRRYPPASILDSNDDCGSDNLEPYLDSLPCDPLTNERYWYYVVSDDGLNYWLYANLEDTEDPVIAERGCQLGCGPDENGDGSGDFNYGVSSAQIVTGEFAGVVTSPPNCPQGCVPNQCGTCCSGAGVRCTSNGVACYTDLTCSQ